MSDTLTVAAVLATVDRAVGSALPGPVWVRGEVTGFRRTSGGAAFFRLADSDVDDVSLDVSARGRVMMEIDRVLDGAGVGALRDGIEVRLRGTVGLDRRRSSLRLSLLEADPSFTAGRLAVDKAEVLRRMRADGSIEVNRRLPIPLVPLRVGLVTSRGSAAHADVLHQLERSGYRFSVLTAHASVQGEAAPQGIAAALDRLARRASTGSVDVVALVRGGGSRLDLAAFDTEEVGRAVAAMPVPVVTGIGHEIDRSVADEAAAVYQKTPSAAGEWLVSIVDDFAGRVGIARTAIREEARAAVGRMRDRLDRSAATLAGAREVLHRQSDLLGHLGSGVAHGARSILERHERTIESLEEFVTTVGLDGTLGRGFAVVTRAADGAVVTSVDDVAAGDGILIRVSDGTVAATVEEA